MLTGLYVSANRPDRFPKAVATGAELVVLDLGHSVPPEEKDAARTGAIDWIITGASGRSCEVEVRVNPVGSPWYEDDLAALAAIPSARVRLSKVESAEAVCEALELVPTARITAL